MDKKINRREAIKQISVVVGGTTAAIVLPSSWTKPVMDAVVGPAAADFSRVSYCPPDGIPNSSICPAPSTTPAPTTGGGTGGG